MFLPPKQVMVDKSGGAFVSGKIKDASKDPQVINPATTLGLGDLANLLPVEKDSFIGSMIGGFNYALASPITTTDGRKKLSTVDPFGKVVNTPQNQLASVLSNYFGTTGAVLGGIVENEPLRNLTKEFIRTGRVDNDVSKAFLKNFNNNLLSGISEVTSPFIKGVQDTIGLGGVDSKQLVSSLLGIEGAPRIEDVLTQNPTISMIVKGKQYLANADFSSANGIFKVLDNLTANTQLSSLFDLKTEFQIMNILTKGLMEFNAPDLFSRVGDWFRNGDSNNTGSGSYDRETAYYLDNLDNAIEMSSMVYLEGLLDRVPASKILDSNRDFVIDFLSKFALRYDEEPSAAIGVRLNELMTKIDANWTKTQLIPGKGEYVTDLKPFKMMSDDACRVFMLAELHLVELTISNYYPIKPVKDYMKSLYPFALN